MEEDKSGRGQISSSLCGKCNTRGGCSGFEGVCKLSSEGTARAASFGWKCQQLFNPRAELNPTNHFAGFANIPGNGNISGLQISWQWQHIGDDDRSGNGNHSGHGNSYHIFVGIQIIFVGIPNIFVGIANIFAKLNLVYPLLSAILLLRPVRTVIEIHGWRDAPL